MNKAYDLWSTEEGKKLSYSDFLDVVSKKYGELYFHAVITGNLNYQVENGGFSQWHYNDYSITIDDLIIFFTNNFKDNNVIDKLKYILNEVVDTLNWLDDGKDCVKNLYDYKEFFIEKLEEEIENDFNSLDVRYYEINKKLNEILEEYFKTEYEKISPEIREENT
jgi:hypothetical protein